MKAPSFVLLLVGATSANQYACATMGDSTSAGGEGFRAVGGTQIVSLYKWQVGIGMPDKYRAMEGFYNLTAGQPPLTDGGPTSAAGEDLGLLPYAYDFALTLALPAGGDFGESTTRLSSQYEQVQPFTQASHTVVYESERVAVARPTGQQLRHACIYQFKAGVSEEMKRNALLDLEESLLNIPGIAHFSCGLDEEEARSPHGALGLVADFEFAEDFDSFFEDPARLQTMQALNPLLAFRTCVDLLVPQDLLEGEGTLPGAVEFRRLRA